MSKRMDEVMEHLKSDGNQDHKLYAIAEMLYEGTKQLSSIAESLEKIAHPLLHVDKDGAVSKVKEVPMCIKFDECGLTEEFCPTCDKYDDGTIKKDGDQDE